MVGNLGGGAPLLPGRRVLRQPDSHMTVTFWEASSADGDVPQQPVPIFLQCYQQASNP